MGAVTHGDEVGLGCRNVSLFDEHGVRVSRMTGSMVFRLENRPGMKWR